ncbi:alpha/beta hydrolase [Tsuneonella sp. HG222]
MKAWLIAGAVTLAALAVVGIALYAWAVRNQSVATLDRLDAAFPRKVETGPPVVAKYGAHRQQRLLVYRPIGVERPDLIVFIHGGGWRSGDPADYAFVARRYAQAGYATALVGYRLGPEGRFPAMLEDSAAAVRWLLDNAGQLGIRADRLVLTGHSAGAYNALMLALDRQWLGRAGVPEGTIKGVAALAGPADFYPFDNPSAVAAFGHVADPASTQPISFARADAPPALLLTGDADTTVKPRNSRVLAVRLAALGADARLVEIPGLGHNQVVMHLARPFDRDRRTSDALLAFLAEVVEGAPSAAVQPTNR